MTTPASPGYEPPDRQAINPLLHLWLHPRATLRYLLAHSPNRYVTPLLVLGGVARAVGRIHYNQLLPATVSGQLLLAVVVGGGFGWLTLYAYAWGLVVTGRWLGGRAHFEALRLVVAWALLPAVVGLAPALLVLDLHSENAFRREVLDVPLSTDTLTNGLIYLQGVLSAWVVGVMLTGIQLVQGFSLGRAVLNMLLPGGILLLFIGGVMTLQHMLLAASS